MGIEPNYVLCAIAIGIGATLIMDLWNQFLKRAFSIPSLSYCLLGRWLRHMPGGTFRHANITATPQKPFECTVGWIAHYTIGVGFALVFVVLVSGDWLARPTLLLALLYGVGTVVFPFFIMQPSLGLGVAASRTPKPMRARLKSLATHTVFGVGLYLCALGVSYVLRFMPVNDIPRGSRMPRIVDTRAVLAVRDLQASTRHYIEVLGFHRDFGDGTDGWSFLSRDAFKVMLGECPDERPASELGNHSYIAYVTVEGVDQFYAEVVARGADVTSAPANKPWGLREFTLRTPDGHRYTFGESLRAGG